MKQELSKPPLVARGGVVLDDRGDKKVPYAFASLCSLTTSAKTIHRIVFFRRQVCSLLVRILNKKEKQCQSITSLFGGELGIFRHTAVCLRVASLLVHVGESSPQDCFLDAQTLSGSSPYRKKSRTSATLSFWQGQKDLNPRHVVLERKTRFQLSRVLKYSPPQNPHKNSTFRI